MRWATSARTGRTGRNELFSFRQRYGDYIIIAWSYCERERVTTLNWTANWVCVYVSARRVQLRTGPSHTYCTTNGWDEDENNKQIKWQRVLFFVVYFFPFRTNGAAHRMDSGVKCGLSEQIISCNVNLRCNEAVRLVYAHEATHWQVAELGNDSLN